MDLKKSPWKDYGEDLSDDKLKQAQDRDKESRRNALFALAGEQMSTGISRNKVDDSLYKHLMGTADRADQVRQRRKDLDSENLMTAKRDQLGEKGSPNYKVESIDVGGRNMMVRINPGTGKVEPLTFDGQTFGKGYTRGTYEGPDGFTYTWNKNTGKLEKVLTPDGGPVSPAGMQSPTQSVQSTDNAVLRRRPNETPVEFELRKKKAEKEQGELVKNEVGAFKNLKTTEATLDRMRSRNQDFIDMYDKAAEEPAEVPFLGIDLPFVDGTGPVGGRIKELNETFGQSAGAASGQLIKQSHAEANQYIKETTGAAMSEPEAKRLGFEMPKIFQDRESFANTMKANEKKYERLILERQRLFEILGPEEYQKRMMLVQTNPSIDPFAGVDMSTSKPAVADQGEQQIRDQQQKPDAEAMIQKVMSANPEASREEIIEALKEAGRL